MGFESPLPSRPLLKTQLEQMPAVKTPSVPPNGSSEDCVSKTRSFIPFHRGKINSGGCINSIIS